MNTQEQRAAEVGWWLLCIVIAAAGGFGLGWYARSPE
jgi:hypothetical protein